MVKDVSARLSVSLTMLIDKYCGSFFLHQNLMFLNLISVAPDLRTLKKMVKGMQANFFFIFVTYP